MVTRRSTHCVYGVGRRSQGENLCRSGRWWQPQELSDLLDEIVEKYKVDKDRIYVTGLSMGGYGVWDAIQRYPRRFAAAVPVCGGGDAARAVTPSPKARPTALLTGLSSIPSGHHK